MVKQEIVNRLMLKVLRHNSNKGSRLLVQSCPQATASCFKTILFLNSIESDLTDVHYQDLVHVVLIHQTGLVFRGVLAILYYLVFTGVQEDLRFPFFLFYHLVREGPGDL